MVHADDPHRDLPAPSPLDNGGRYIRAPGSHVEDRQRVRSPACPCPPHREDQVEVSTDGRVPAKDPVQPLEIA